MLDPTFYMQHILPAAQHILANNQASLGQQFCNEFMYEHDISNSSPNAQKNATKLFSFVIQNSANPNGGPVQIQPQQMHNLVTHYIGGMHQTWTQAQRPQMSMGLGMGRPLGMAAAPQGFTSPMGGMQTPVMGAAVQGMGDVITPGGQVQQPSIVAPAPVAPVLNPQVQTQAPVTPMADNPLDNHNDVDLVLVDDEAANWGTLAGEDRSIAILNRATIKSKDDKIIIRKVDGFLRTYNDNPLAVAQHFFKVAPDQFLAESFIFRLFYNNIEIVPVATETFKGVRDAFIAAMDKDRKGNAYRAIIKILDDLKHGARQIMEKYLLKHINRAMHLSAGMMDHPQIRLKFGAIEDLDELLGTNFTTKLFEVPRSREYIQEIVCTAIINALTGYSDVLFSSFADCDSAIIKTSSVFPFNLENVYPNKALIPGKDDPDFQEFYSAMGQKQLTHKTFVRSIRSIIVTNILGAKALTAPSTKPTIVPGDFAAILGTYALNHTNTSAVTGEECKKFDLFTLADGNEAEAFRGYLKQPGVYERKEQEDASETKQPALPVDQVLFAVQFKKSPNAYLEAFDIFTAMDYSSAKHPLVLARTPTVLNLF